MGGWDLEGCLRYLEIVVLKPNFNNPMSILDEYWTSVFWQQSNDKRTHEVSGCVYTNDTHVMKHLYPHVISCDQCSKNTCDCMEFHTTLRKKWCQTVSDVPSLVQLLSLPWGGKIMKTRWHDTTVIPTEWNERVYRRPMFIEISRIKKNKKANIFRNCLRPPMFSKKTR